MSSRGERHSSETRRDRRRATLLVAAGALLGAGLAPQPTWSQASAEARAPTETAPAVRRDGELLDELEVLRRGFAAWWSQPPGPSASQGFVRERADERRLELRTAARGETSPPPERPRQAAPRSAAPAAAPLPALRPLELTGPAESIAPTLFETATSEATEGRLAAAPPAATEPGLRETASTPAEERRKLAALLGLQALTGGSTARQESAEIEEALATELANDPATSLPVATAAPEVEVRRLDTPLQARPDQDAAEAIALTSQDPQPAPNGEDGLWEQAVVETVPASSGGVWRREVEPAPTPAAVAPTPSAPDRGYAAQAAAERSLFADPTVRIGLAFLVGIGLLCLAFLREWSAARRRYEYE